MNLVNEYKREVRSISLSAGFKENLKDLCLNELSSHEQRSDTSGATSKIKIYKYISIAACLIAAISTIGVVSMLSDNLSYRSNKNDAYNASAEQEVQDNTGIGENTAETVTGGTNSVTVEEDTPVEEASPEVPELPASDTESNMIASDTIDPEADMILDSIMPYSGENYDGDYYTEDYVLMLDKTASIDGATVYSNYDEFIEGASSESGALARNASVNALNFYDVLDTRLADAAQTMGVSLVRMTVNGTVDDSPVQSPEDGLYTLYDVNIEYDYLNLESCDVNAYVWIKGTDENQLEGMPVYEAGDTLFTSLYVTESGSVTAVDELLYDVYTLNDLMIAYHRVYEDINPGYTDMGILDSEREFITTTSNNPVEYVHKAATSELSRYIRRKILEYEYPFASLEELALVSRGEAMPEVTDEPEDTQTLPVDAEEPVYEGDPITSLVVHSEPENMVITARGEQIMLNDEASAQYLSSEFRSSATGSIGSTTSTSVMFVGGRLIFDSPYAFSGNVIEIEVTGAGCPLDIGFNGVKVGDSLDYVKELLGLDQYLDDNCIVEYTDGTVRATLTFEYGVLTKILIR